MPTPSVGLKIDGRAAEPAVLHALEEIEVEDHLELASIAKVRFRLQANLETGDWGPVNDGDFAALTPLLVSITDPTGPTHTLFEGYVMERRMTFTDPAAQPTLEVTAMDPSVKLDQDEKVTEWPDVSDSQVAEELLSAAGFTPDVEDTTVVHSAEEETLFQRGSDMAFLRSLAQRNGFVCYIESDPTGGDIVGHFHPPRVDETPQGVLSVAQGPRNNLRSLDLRYEMMAPARHAGSTVEIADKGTQTNEAGAQGLALMGAEDLVTSESPVRHADGALPATFAQLVTLTQVATDRSAWAVVAEGELDTTRYGGVLRAKRTVLVRGAGARFDGTFMVTRARHRLHGALYDVDFTLLRNAVGEEGDEEYASEATP